MIATENKKKTYLIHKREMLDSYYTVEAYSEIEAKSLVERNGEDVTYVHSDSPKHILTVEKVWEE